MSETSQGPGWWLAADGKWYPPDQPPAPGWWRASDGNWYPPTDAAAPPASPAPSTAPATAAEPAAAATPTESAPSADVTTPAGPAPVATESAPATRPPTGPPGAPTGPPPAGGGEPNDGGGRGKGLVIVGVIVVVVLLAVGGIFLARRGGSESVATGASPSTAGANGSGGNGNNGGGNNGGSDSGGGATPGPSDDGPGRDVTLASDVVVVKGGGGKAIKSFSPDGQTIVLDPAADGIDKLSEGKVLLLTGVTAVRVKSLDKTADGISITTAPVTLPEVVQDANLKWDNQVNADQGRFHVIAPADSSAAGADGTGSGAGSGDGSGLGTGGLGSGGGLGTGDGSGDGTDDGTGTDGPDINGGLTGESAAAPAPAAHLTPARSVLALGPSAAGADVPSFVPTGVVRADAKTISGMVGPLAADISYEPNGNGANFHVKLTSTADVSGTIDLDVKVHSLNNTGHATVEGGTTKEFSFDMADLSGNVVVETDLKSVQNVAKIKIPPFFKLPFSVDFPAPVGGIPFTLSLGGSIQVSLAMALAQANLAGRAEISYSGDAGFDFRGGNVALNGNRIQDAPDLLNTVTKLTNGPVGVVVTAELPKIGFGFSFLQTGAEVYISNGMVASQTVLPSPRQCVAMNVAYVLAGGVEAKFLGKGFDIARKPFVKKEWNFQAPSGTSCNAPK